MYNSYYELSFMNSSTTPTTRKKTAKYARFNFIAF